MGKFKSFCYLFMDTLFIHGKSEIYDFVIGEIFYFTKREKKGFVGHTRWAAHTPIMAKWVPPSMGHFCTHTPKMSRFWVAHLTQ